MVNFVIAIAMATSFISSSSAAPTNATATTPTSSTPTGITYAQSATSLLPLPSYAVQSSFATSAAAAIATSLPGYSYNLTSETMQSRIAICGQTTSFCASSKCSIATSNVTTNFCNPATMGWNCLCNGGAVSRLQPPIVPVNSYDCRLRTGACQQACQNKNATPPILSITACQNACTYIIGDTCSTGNQVIPQYQVNSFNDTPSYYPNTSGGGVASGITTKSGAERMRVIGSLVVGAIAIVGGGWVLLG